jgi:predicted nucleic acid-binding protein
VIFLVLDSSVVLKWFHRANELHLHQADGLRRLVERGDIEVVVPSIFLLEMVNIPAGKWGMRADALSALVDAVLALEFTVEDVNLHAVAQWAAAGLSAYDACYVVAAQARSVPLITADEQIPAVAPAIATHLRDWSPGA